MMRLILVINVMHVALLLPVHAQNRDIIQASVVPLVQKGCAAEINNHCAEVKPGDGALASCLSAYRHKLSKLCQQALRSAGDRMAKSLALLKQAVVNCKTDIPPRCPNLQPGRTNVLACITKLNRSLTPNCRKGLANFNASLR